MKHLGTIATVSLAMALGATAQATTIGPDAYGYIAADVSYAWEDISGTGKLVLTSDDDAYATEDLDFAFNFYGQEYTKVYWSTNGLVTFGGSSTQFTNQDLTSAGATWTYDGPSIAALWDDWKSTTFVGDGTYYETRGTPGSRRFIIQWSLMQHYDDGVGRHEITFQALLYEGSGSILLQYKDVAVGHTGIDNGLSATVGIRDTAGQTNGRNLQWSYNQAVIGNGTSILFSGPVPEPVTLTGLITGIGCLAGYVRRRQIT